VKGFRAYSAWRLSYIRRAVQAEPRAGKKTVKNKGLIAIRGDSSQAQGYPSANKYERHAAKNNGTCTKLFGTGPELMQAQRLIL
jgi:hypothetical protein